MTNVTLPEIEHRLQKLREEYAISTRSHQATILLQARALTIARDRLRKKHGIDK